MCEKRRGLKLIKEFDADEKIVAMIEFRGEILIATSFGIYKVKGDKLEKIELIMEAKEISLRRLSLSWKRRK